MWVVKRRAQYWDLGLFGGPVWMDHQVDACKFTQRSRAASVAKRTGARVVRLAASLPTQAEAEVARLRAALEDVLLFEHPPGGAEAWKRAWSALRFTLKA